MHGQLFGRDGLTQILDHRESIDHLVVHAGDVDELASLAEALGFVQRHVGVANDVRQFGGGGVPHDDPETGPLLEAQVADHERFVEGTQKPLGDHFGLVRPGDPFGEVEEFVAPEATQGVGRSRDPFESMRDGRQELIADQVSVGVVHPFEVIEVQ